MGEKVVRIGSQTPHKLCLTICEFCGNIELTTMPVRSPEKVQCKKCDCFESRDITDTEYLFYTRVKENIGEQETAIQSAEEIMVDAVRHLSRAQMGQDNNELAGRMQEWLTEFAG